MSAATGSGARPTAPERTLFDGVQGPTRTTHAGRTHLSYTYHRQTIKHVQVPADWTQA